MMNEKMERTMQFILEQQAQLVANQQQADERISRLETSMAELQTSMAALAQTQVGLSERVSRLETNMADMLRTQTHMNEVAAAMLDTHKHTEEKLDAFIGVLERYISEDRSGRSNGGSVA